MNELPASPVWFRYTIQSVENAFEPVTFFIDIDPETLQHATPHRDAAPAWTAFDEARCAGRCGLNPAAHAHCPLALSLVDLIDAFGGAMSHADVDVTVESPRRTYSARTTMQRALSSLAGLHMATSGCPAFAPLRSMARFHLPFASIEETVYRAASSYLMAEYFRYQETGKFDFNLSGLRAVFERTHELNLAITQELRGSSDGDAHLNALVILDLFSQTLPLAVEQKLGELRPLFPPWE